MTNEKIGYRLYRTKAWADCRAIYLSEHPYCERCLQVGIWTAATQVHHKIWLTPDNVGDPEVTLNPENLEALCDVCHAKEHHAASDVGDGLQFDADGNLISTAK